MSRWCDLNAQVLLSIKKGVLFVYKHFFVMVLFLVSVTFDEPERVSNEKVQQVIDSAWSKFNNETEWVKVENYFCVFILE